MSDVKSLKDTLKFEKLWLLEWFGVRRPLGVSELGSGGMRCSNGCDILGSDSFQTRLLRRMSVALFRYEQEDAIIWLSS